MVVAAEFVEPGAPGAEFIRADFVAAEGGEEFADQRRTETMGKLLLTFFVAARMREPSGVGEHDASGFARTLFAFDRNATETISRLQERRAG